MKNILTVIITIILISSCSNDRSLEKKYELQKPTEFIINSFKEKDIIFLGEYHRFKTHVDFVSNLIPELSKNGINIIFTEFARYEDTPLIDSLVTSSIFDEALAKKIIINHNWTWHYKEYIDIFRKAWEINQTRDRENIFRIIGINNSLDYNLTTENPDFWGGTEEDFAQRIEIEAISKNKKALVHCGLHHSLTRYLQPKVNDEGELVGFYKKNGRVGQIIYSNHPNRCMSIWLHSPLFSKNMETCNINPLNGELDSIYNKLQKPYAFNTHTSILGQIADTISYYSVGYNNFNLEMITDGYIVLSPLSKVEYVHRIENFIDSENIKTVQIQAKAFENIDSISIDSANYYLGEWFRDNLKDFNDNKEKYWR